MSFAEYVGRQVDIGNVVMQMPQMHVPATDEDVIEFEETIAAIQRAAAPSVEVVKLAKELQKGLRTAIEACFVRREAEESGNAPKDMFAETEKDAPARGRKKQNKN